MRSPATETDWTGSALGSHNLDPRAPLPVPDREQEIIPRRKTRRESDVERERRQQVVVRVRVAKRGKRLACPLEALVPGPGTRGFSDPDLRIQREDDREELTVVDSASPVSAVS